MEKKINRWVKLSRETKRDLSPSGTGKLPVIQYERDNNGCFHKKIVGYTNLQEQMNKEAKEINLINMLKEVEAGTRERVEGFSNASDMPQNKYEARKRIENLVNLWDKNPLLRLVYGSKEHLLKDLNDGVDVFKKVKTYGDDLLKPIDKVEDEPKKEIKQEPKQEVKTDGVNKSEEK